MRCLLNFISVIDCDDLFFYLMRLCIYCLLDDQIQNILLDVPDTNRLFLAEIILPTSCSDYLFYLGNIIYSIRTITCSSLGFFLALLYFSKFYFRMWCFCYIFGVSNYWYGPCQNSAVCENITYVGAVNFFGACGDCVVNWSIVERIHLV